MYQILPRARSLERYHNGKRRQRGLNGAESRGIWLLYLDRAKSPSSKVHELDNRGSHFYLTMYWAQALAEQAKNPELQAKFAKLAQQLNEDEGAILAELNRAQGQVVEIGGYYHPDKEKAIRAMRPSGVFGNSIDSFG